MNVEVFTQAILLGLILYLIGGICCSWAIGQLDKYFLLLIQPVVGLGLIVVCGFVLNGTLGLAVESYAKIVLGVTVVTGTLSISLRRDEIQKVISARRKDFAFLLLSVTASGAVLTTPSFSVGDSWVAYGNEDWTNYLLASQRLLRQGLFDDSKLGMLPQGTDYSQATWYYHVIDGVRPGAEQFLAFFSSALNRQPHELYMSVVVLISLLTGLVVGWAYLMVRTSQFPAWAVAIPAVLAPNAILGMTYQLIAQQAGILFGVTNCGLAILLFRSTTRSNARSALIVDLLFLISYVAQLIWYPEMSVLSILGLLLTWIAVFISDRERARHTAARLMRIGLSVFIVLLASGLALRVARFFFAQLKLGNDNTDIFPYYLKPTGLPSIVGLTPFWFGNGVFNRWQLDAIIFLSGVLMLVVCIVVISRAFKIGNEVASHGFIFLAMCIYLFYDSAGFGLFKIAMWQQPFLLLAIAITMKSHYKPAKIRLMHGAALIVVASMVPTTYYYLRASEPGFKGRGPALIPSFTDQTIEQLTRVRKDALMRSSKIVLLGDNPSALKFSTYLLQGAEVSLGEFQDLFSYLQASRIKSRERTLARFGPHLVDFPIPDVSNSQSLEIILPSRSAINRAFEDKSGGIRVDPEEPQLVFVPSSLASWWAEPGKRFESAFSLPEPDPFTQGGYMQSFQRYALFKVTGELRRFRLRISVSSSFLPQQDYELPSLTYYGSKVVYQELSGKGSATVISPVIEPLEHLGSRYVLIDFGVEPRMFPPVKMGGLADIYGSKIQLDQRRVSIFVRDISVADEQASCETYLKNVRLDLDSAGLCYSGIFEDGWMSRRVRFEFTPGDLGKMLQIDGLLQNPSNRAREFVVVNGESVPAKAYPCGRVVIETRIKSSTISIDLSGLGLRDVQNQRVLAISSLRLGTGLGDTIQNDSGCLAK